ncbi:PD-(D/E)XK nuclease family protein [Rhabdochromatium marinum]|uniref:PD-(D/E)XK nuclease family protein n=1 Tax=Rhabdochromatium marinum TaxID=48729 RepID=UPI003084221C
MNDALIAMAKKHDRSIGALGARWGLQLEKTFRDALASILEENFAVQVINYNGYDDQGEVFGRPEQIEIELDVIIKNGLLILCELKSSIDKGGMYLFERKARFYECEHYRKASRLIVISPMIEPKALPVAERLGIDCFGDSLEVEQL